MKRIEAIKAMYGRPQSETINASGGIVSGWHLEDKAGEILKLDGMSEDDVERIYDASAPSPEKPFFLKFKGKWVQVESVDTKCMAPVVQGRELSREDTICLDIAEEIKNLCILLPLLSGMKTSPSVQEEARDCLRLLNKSINELPLEIK